LLEIEVFGRDPEQPPCRVLSQPGQESELRIELPAGCYMPEFQL